MWTKRSLTAAGVAAAGALVLSGCGQAPDEAPEAAGGEESVDYKACIVSDAGGWDDQSFNQSGYEGLMAAVDEFGIEHAEAQSQSDADFGPNVDSMVQQGCNVVFGVGFLLEEALHDAAEANPETDFALIDSTFSDADGNPAELENGKPLVFNTAEAAYLAGYVAAAMSETGTVATFGGMQIPSVTIFMDGFADGVDRYNEDNGEDVQLLGWNKESQQGSFSGDFDNQSQGRTIAEQFLSQDADVIMPVAGPVGLGAAAAIDEVDDAKLIWVDSDGYESTEHGDIILTSVLKQISQAVYDTVEEGVNDQFDATPYVGTLENEGVGLAPFHDFEDEVPQEVKDKVDELRQEIISGETVVETENAP
ncbi:BMP family ABC transporter substrate-binding protein [Sediminivirga luteola]|uniref:BMP family ABC transporter substrate-binding protein n=2 Tax=Sediminivirga luteola TaxID=1774748 RepID=A0A8J2TXU0_9MICO|nr:BMP family ABC transporter substrate-binding protein [Sediminivirga luteola]